MKWNEKQEKLFRAVGEVGEDLVFFAEVARFPNHFRKWLSTAAALALVIGLTVVALPFLPQGCGSMSEAPAYESVTGEQKENLQPDLGEATEAPKEPEAPADEKPEEPETETEPALFAYYDKDENNAYASAPLSAEQTAELRELLYNAEWADNELPPMGFPCDYSLDIGEDHIMVMMPDSGWELRSPVIVRCPDKTYDILLSPEKLEELYGLLEEIRIQIEEGVDSVETEGGFWALFPELDRQSTDAYLEEHPALTENGWADLVVSRLGYDKNGLRCYEETGIFTTGGDRVLVIDVPNRILLVRIRDEAADYQGVLAIAKDPSRLSLQVCEHYGVDGNNVGTIADAHNGVLAINASGVLPVEYSELGGGVPVGYLRADGRDRNGASEELYDRLELGEDNFLRITSGDEPLGDDVTDAMEFIPAMIIDGQVQEAVADWDGLAPRTCIGQRENGELLMLVIEGQISGYSEGTDLPTCAAILQEYDAYQAMALDYGDSSMMWYDGLYVTKCSHIGLPAGHFLPDAFVYSRKGS